MNYHFAWAAMAGVAIAMTDHAQLDVGSRFLDLGPITGISPVTGTSVTQRVRANEVRLGATLSRAAFSAHGLDNAVDHFLSVAEKHRCIGPEKQFIIDAGVASAHSTFDEEHVFGVLHIEDRHSIDRRG
jgi:hypothetical protein